MPHLPDSVHVMTDVTRPHTATPTTEGVWSVRGTRITTDRTPEGLRLRARAGAGAGAGAEGLSRIVLRWGSTPPRTPASWATPGSAATATSSDARCNPTARCPGTRSSPAGRSGRRWSGSADTTAGRKPPDGRRTTAATAP
ncbi:hypothetical protein [Streptomyces sp. SAS_260]|uniref:hypothetical protein n=1 Tax=Streptomyces sp. SAS_260 TaxID=3412751 RepID=UPI00403CFB4D